MNYNNQKAISRKGWRGLIFTLFAFLVFTLGLIFIFCHRQKSTARAKDVAEKVLLASVANPESVKIITVSEVDSVFGHEYITMDEKMAISMAMMRVNEKVMQATDGLDNLDLEDTDMTELLERQMSAMTALRSLTSATLEQPHGNTDRRLTGWKVKIEYEATSESGHPYRSEYWFILDRDATCVIKTFEIPLL